MIFKMPFDLISVISVPLSVNNKVDNKIINRSAILGLFWIVFGNSFQNMVFKNNFRKQFYYVF